MDRTRRDELTTLFLRHVCQTSPGPLGIVIDRARGAKIWDVDGREYLDLLSGMGVAGIGHCNPEVVEAIRAQASRYLHATVYGESVQAPQVELARRIAKLAPGDLSVTYFANSGTEAIEGALKLARKHTGRQRFIAFRGGYHGDTTGSLALCDNAVYRRPFEPLQLAVDFLPFGEVAGLDRIDSTVAAVVVEPIQAEGGVRIPPDEFHPALRRACDEAGALLVFDEVMTGLGRTGRWLACEHWAVRPDVLVLAKALGGGLPLGAFVGSSDLMAELSHDPPLCHVTTFGGHPLSCAAGLAALEFAEREDVPARAERQGRVWLARLRSLLNDRLVEVRGLGMLLGLEFASPELTQAFARRATELGLILNWTLHRDTVIRLAPPLVMTEEETEHALTTLASAVATMSDR
jgi:acetylornithine/succinyldiaminopimelate/putrescine aminotransferase